MAIVFPLEGLQIIQVIAIILFGDSYAFGSIELMYNAFVFRKVMISFIVNFSVCFLVIKYVFPRMKSQFIVIIFFAQVLITILFISPFLTNSGYLYQVSLSGFYKKLLPLKILPVAFLLIYFILVRFINRPAGVGIHFFAFAFMIDQVFELTDCIAKITGINTYGADQYFLIFSLFCMSFSLLFRYILLHSEKQQLREKLIYDVNFLTQLQVIDHDYTMQNLVNIFKEFWQKRAVLLHLALGFLFFTLAISVKSFYVSVKLVIFTLWIGAVYFILSHIYHVKIRDGQILNKTVMNSLKQIGVKNK